MLNPCYSLGKKCITWTKAFQVVCSFRPVLETVRHSHQKCSMKKGVLKNFAKFTGKHLSQSLFFKSLCFNSVYPSSSSNLEKKGSLQLY